MAKDVYGLLLGLRIGFHLNSILDKRWISIAMKTRSVSNHHGPILDQVPGYEVVDCTICGFAHIMPLPDADAVERIYSEQYYSDVKPEYFTNTEEDREWWNLSYDDRLRTLENELPLGRRRLLDIGSGPGLFLDRARQRGWNAVGVEPSIAAADYSRAQGNEVICGFFNEELAKGIGTFDVINLSNVLEHVPNPGGLITSAMKSMNDDALLCICVPNDYNCLQLALRKTQNYPPWWLAAPHHVNYFTFQSLEKLLSRVGLVTISRSTSFPMELFLLLGFNYTNDSSLGRDCHRRRKGFEIALEDAGMSHLRAALHRSFASLEIGREVIIIARKATISMGT